MEIILNFLKNTNFPHLVSLDNKLGEFECTTEKKKKTNLFTTEKKIFLQNGALQFIIPRVKYRF